MEENKFKSDEERLAAIRKTQEEMASPEGVDFARAVKKAIDQYWQDRQEAAEIWSTVEVGHAKDSYRTAALLFWVVAALSMLIPFLVPYDHTFALVYFISGIALIAALAGLICTALRYDHLQGIEKNSKKSV